MSANVPVYAVFYKELQYKEPTCRMPKYKANCSSLGEILTFEYGIPLNAWSNTMNSPLEAYLFFMLFGWGLIRGGLYEGAYMRGLI